MAFNSLGELFTITSYGESHGKEVGVVIDGCPAGLSVDLSFIQKELDRRKPGQSALTTSRKESDEFEVVSGVFRGVTTGSPILIRIPNQNAKSEDYSDLEDVFRPSHADQSYQLKYGHRDHRGGGRSSARITAGWVAAGAIAKLILQQISKVSINAYVKQVHQLEDQTPISEIDWTQIEKNATRSANEESNLVFSNLIKKMKDQGESVGGVIRGVFINPDIGLGDPVFGKLHAKLGQALLSINAVKGIGFGSGFGFTTMTGSEANDQWSALGDTTIPTNKSGGIQGGISNGLPIYFDLAFKPTASISKPQNALDGQGNIVHLEITGRHDPCVLPRAVPIVESICAIVYLNALLAARSSKLQ